jgi:FdhE protein
VLEFYSHIARFQETVREDREHLAARLPELLALAGRFGPAPLAAEAAKVQPAPAAEAFFEKALLQPWAERLPLPEEPWQGRLCPRCGSKPVVGVLRPEGHGAKRTLVCSLCSLEWPFPRIECPACGERSAGELAVYTAERFEAARVEACGKCRVYLLCADLTRSALAVPQVDELAMIPLDLWAREQGYVKLQTNMFGM